MTLLKHLVLAVAVLVLAVFPSAGRAAEAVTVSLHADSGFSNPGGITQKLETTLGRLLTQINTAYTQQQQAVDITDIQMDQFATKAINELWNNIHFYCDDREVFDRLWTMNKGYMVRQIPLILDDDDSQGGGNGIYQEAMVEFDLQGRITDFRLTFDSWQSESMERCGNAVADLERRMQILSYCDRFRTAYCTKDMAYLQQVFSDDALIITGKVVTSKPKEMSAPKTTVKYTQQTKKQYLDRLALAFKNNKYIDVKFTEIGQAGNGCGAITRSPVNKNIYGVRLRQEWRSSSYSDDGFVFLLWDFTDEQHPVIHVRTWQPEYLDKEKTKRMAEDDIFSLSSFDL